MIKNIFIKYYIVLAFVIMVVIPNCANSVSYDSYTFARIQVLNKITGKSEIHDVKSGSVYNFDEKLSLVIKVCYKATQRYTPEDVIFLQVVEASSNSKRDTALYNNVKLLQNANSYINNKDVNKSNNNGLLDNLDNSKDKQSSLIFSGWIFSNYPELSGLTNPTYDITLIKCLTEE